MKQYTQNQFEQILEILIHYKKCCPDKEVSLTEKSLHEATEFFMKSGLFESLKSNQVSE